MLHSLTELLGSRKYDPFIGTGVNTLLLLYWTRGLDGLGRHRLWEIQTERENDLQPSSTFVVIAIALVLMSLIHALLAEGQTILAEHKAGDRDFSQAIQTILSKIPQSESKLTYAWEQYHFHYISDGVHIYLVMADDAAGRRMPFAFLSDLQKKFMLAPSSSSRDFPPNALQGTFGPVIAALMHTYNTAPPSDELARAQNELNQVKDIMVQNVEQILSRGERIDLLVNKTDAIAGQATAFRRGARTVRQNMWWKNMKIMILSVFVALLITYLLIAHACGLRLDHCGS